MAAGRTHDLINLSVLPVAVYYLQPENFFGFITGYLVGTFFISPDNDLMHSKPNKRWKLLRFIWFPYTKIFSHRGVSHLPIIGSLTRIFYITVLFLILALSVYVILYIYDPSTVESINLNNTDILSVIKNPFVFSFLFGIILAEIVHILTDVVYSTAKRLKIIR